MSLTAHVSNTSVCRSSITQGTHSPELLTFSAAWPRLITPPSWQQAGLFAVKSQSCIKAFPHMTSCQQHAANAPLACNCHPWCSILLQDAMTEYHKGLSSGQHLNSLRSVMESDGMMRATACPKRISGQCNQALATDPNSSAWSRMLTHWWTCPSLITEETFDPHNSVPGAGLGQSCAMPRMSRLHYLPMHHRLLTHACMPTLGTWDVCHNSLEDLVQESALKLLHCAPCPIDVNGPWEEVLKIGPQEDAAHDEAVLPPRQKGF